MTKADYFFGLAERAYDKSRRQNETGAHWGARLSVLESRMWEKVARQELTTIDEAYRWLIAEWMKELRTIEEAGQAFGSTAITDNVRHMAARKQADYDRDWKLSANVWPVPLVLGPSPPAPLGTAQRDIARLAAENERRWPAPRKEPASIAKLVVGRVYWTKIGSDWQKVVVRGKIHEQVPGSSKIRWGVRVSREGDERILPKLRSARSLHEEIPKQAFEAHEPGPPSEPKTAAGREIAQQEKRGTYDATTARRLAKALDLDRFAETRLTFDKALRDRIAALQAVKANRSEILAVIRGAMKGANRGRCETLLQELATQAMRAGASNMPPLTPAEIAPRARDIGCPPDVAEDYYARGYRAGQKRARLAGRKTGDLFGRAPSPKPQAPSPERHAPSVFPEWATTHPPAPGETWKLDSGQAVPAVGLPAGNYATRTFGPGEGKFRYRRISGTIHVDENIPRMGGWHYIGSVRESKPASPTAPLPPMGTQVVYESASGRHSHHATPDNAVEHALTLETEGKSVLWISHRDAHESWTLRGAELRAAMDKKHRELQGKLAAAEVVRGSTHIPLDKPPGTIALANKIRGGRAVGNLYTVKAADASLRSFEDQALAYAFARDEEAKAKRPTHAAEEARTSRDWWDRARSKPEYEAVHHALSLHQGAAKYVQAARQKAYKALVKAMGSEPPHRPEWVVAATLVPPGTEKSVAKGGDKIVYETPRGYITLEQTGKSQSYIVWTHGAVAAVRVAAFGTGVSNAFERAKARLDPPSEPVQASSKGALVIHGHHHEGGIHHLSVTLDRQESVVVADMREANQAVREFIQRGGRPSTELGEVRDEQGNIVGRVSPQFRSMAREKALRQPAMLPAPRREARWGSRLKAQGSRPSAKKCGPGVSGCVLVREYWRRAGKKADAAGGPFKVILAEGGGKFESERSFPTRSAALQHRDILRAGGVLAKVIDKRGNEVE